MGDADVSDVPIPCRNVADENCGAGRDIAVVSSLKRWQNKNKKFKNSLK